MVNMYKYFQQQINKLGNNEKETTMELNNDFAMAETPLTHEQLEKLLAIKADEFNAVFATTDEADEADEGTATSPVHAGPDGVVHTESRSLN